MGEIERVGRCSSSRDATQNVKSSEWRLLAIAGDAIDTIETSAMQREINGQDSDGNTSDGGGRRMLNVRFAGCKTFLNNQQKDYLSVGHGFYMDV